MQKKIDEVVAKQQRKKCYKVVRIPRMLNADEIRGMNEGLREYLKVKKVSELSK